MTSHTKKYRCLSFEEKGMVVAAVEDGEKKKNVADRFGIPPLTLSTILKNKDKLPVGEHSRGKMRSRRVECPELEKSVLQWFQQCRQENIPISGPFIKEKAKKFAVSFGIEDFKASDGWLHKFKKRHGIGQQKMSGESAAVDDEICEEWKERLRELLEDYAPRNIFNADESGLFYKCLPDRTLTFKGETCHGGKHSKERITILFATNMDGSEKLKPLVIGKSKKPRCFKGVTSFPLTYCANTKVWMTAVLFRQWLQALDKDMKKQKRKIILFIDNCTAHNDVPTLKNVKLEFLPPNTTSKLQPLDQGIIKVFKGYYRTEIVRKLLECIDEGREVNAVVNVYRQ